MQDALLWRDQNTLGNDYILPKIAERYQRNYKGIQLDAMKIIRCATGLETSARQNSDGRHQKLATNAYSLHSFRHTFVSFCAENNVPMSVVAEIVGHGSPATTEHYVHISTPAKQKAIDALPTFASSSVKRQNKSMLRDMIEQKLETLSPDRLKRLLDSLDNTD